MQKKDWIIIIIILAAALIAGLCFAFGNSGAEYISISVDGEMLRSLSVNADGCHILEGADYQFTLMVEQGKVWVINALCPDKICEHTGRISRSGQSIVCLPNKVIIKLENIGQNELDTIM